MFPILSDLAAILERQKRKGGGYEPESGAKWDWGWRIHPTTGSRKWHNGLDLPAPTGTPIYAPIAGTVYAGEDGTSGKYIKLAHSDPSYPDVIQTVYCHLSRFGSGISTGVRVAAGQLIGYVGSTGRSTGPHLHFIIRTKQGEIYEGAHHKDTDPLPYLEGKKNAIAGVGILGGGLLLAVALYWWYTKH
jgi:murein DD-endopeptidase MepM/ murein hydrolase activator NlpD